MNFFKRFWMMLINERGQVPGEGEPEKEELEKGPEGEEETLTETPAGDPPATDQPEKQAQTDFLSDSKKRAEVMALINGNPALKQAYGWMQSGYQKKMAKSKELEQKASLVDRFYSEPQFAIQTIQEVAKQHGYTLTRAQAGAIASGNAALPQAATGASNVPPEYIEMAKQSLPPELQWMAESQAKATYNMVQAGITAALKPYEQKTQEATKAQMDKEYEGMAEELSKTVPGWEEHEDEMSELLDFLHSGQMRHKKYGSKLQLLYNMVTGNAVATQEAGKRIAQAAKNRTSSSQAVRTTTNIGERIRKASNNDAWALAAQAAEEELEKNGRRVAQ